MVDVVVEDDVELVLVDVVVELEVVLDVVLVVEEDVEVVVVVEELDEVELEVLDDDVVDELVLEVVEVDEVDELVLVLDVVLDEVLVLDVVDVEVDEDVEVQVKSVLPNKNSDISAILGHYYSCTTTLTPTIKSQVVLDWENPHLAASDSRPIFDNGSVIKGQIQLVLAFIIDFNKVSAHKCGCRKCSPSICADTNNSFGSSLG